MNNDVPETLAAARSRAADLEQQLKLSDEGVSGWHSGVWSWNNRC
mgnify:FL=1